MRGLIAGACVTVGVLAAASFFTLPGALTIGLITAFVAHGWQPLPPAVTDTDAEACEQVAFWLTVAAETDDAAAWALARHYFDALDPPRRAEFATVFVDRDQSVDT